MKIKMMMTFQLLSMQEKWSKECNELKASGLYTIRLVYYHPVYYQASGLYTIRLVYITIPGNPRSLEYHTLFTTWKIVLTKGTQALLVSLYCGCSEGDEASYNTAKNIWDISK